MGTRPTNNASSCSKQRKKKKLIPTPQILLPPSSLLLVNTTIGIMLLLRATTPFAYAKVDKVDADEARHWQAQFLIHKVLEGKGPARRPPAALERGGGCRVVRAARIGVRLKRLRLAVRTIRLRLYRSVNKHLRRLAHGIGSPRS